MTSATYPVAEVKRLYQRISELELWKEDAIEQISLLSEENEKLRDGDVDRDSTLQFIAEGARILSKVAASGMRVPEAEIFARDFAPWKNVMAFHGIDQKPKRARK